jgi:N-glycosylase/DNA lyase
LIIWSDWKPLRLRSPVSGAVLAEILDGGQAFRWLCGSDGVWTGAWAGNVVRLRPSPANGLQWSAPSAAAAAAQTELERYLDADGDADGLADTLPWRSDGHLARCLAAYPGLRLLRQPIGETLLCFLCSATKRIVQIKQMVARLAANHGASLRFEEPDGPPRETDGRSPRPLFQRLPTWEELGRVPEAELRECGLGFRARHVHRTAQFLAERPGWLEATEAAPYGEARERLRSLPGVGEKIADCVLLFGAGRLEAFPVDVWILRAMAGHYGLRGWKPGQIAQFGRAHFGPLAGLAQQYLFAWERRRRS